MFKKKPETNDKQKAKELKRVHKSDDLQRTYELGQQLANELADEYVEQPQPVVPINCCKIF